MADIKITVDSSELKRATQHTEELRGATSRFEAKLKPLIDKERQFNKAVRQVNDAMRLGVATQKQAIAEVERLGKAYGRTKEQIDRTTASMTGIRKNTNRMNATIQNAGYQFGDFFVQVQSGQNALVAFSQQGAQLAGLMPGLAGAVAGVGLVLGSMLARALMESGALMKSFVGESEDAQKSLERLIGSTSRLADVVDKDLGAAITNYSRAMNELDLKRATEDAKAQMEALEGALRTSKALENYTFGLSKGKFKAAYQEISDETRKAVNALKEMDDLDFNNLEEVEGRLEFITGLLTDLTKETGLSDKNFDSLRQTADLLSERAEQLRESVGDTADASGEVVEEFAAQKAHLEAILKLEQARDRIAGSLDQKFAASTRKLELMRGGLGAGLAGTQVNMEAQIAQAVAAERAVVEARQGVDMMFPAEVEGHMLAFEAGLRSRLEGYMQEQAAIKELSRVKTSAVSVDRTRTEQLDSQVEAYLKYQETINKVLATTEQELRQRISLIGLGKEEAELQKFIYDLEKKMGATRANLNEEQVAQYETILELRREEIALTDKQRQEEEKLQAAKEKVQSVSSTLASETVGALKSIVNGTKTASEAFRDMALNIIQQIMDILIWQPLIQSLTNSISGAISGSATGGGTMGGIVGSIFGFQKGGVFSAGNIVPFANGGIVGSPTMFGMSGGRTGLMGEAGPEAIMPLKRGPDGKLGVQGSGSVTVHQTFNFAANGDDSVKKIIAEAAPKIAKMTEAQIINSRQRGGQMRRAFG